jgi:hypothetical protein
MTWRAFILLLALAMGSARIGWACPPPVMLWAWERPDDLSGLDPRVAGVAYLAKTLILAGNEVLVRPRRQPLRVPVGIELVPVVRIEAARQRPPALMPAQIERLAGEIALLARPDTPAVQIDFDATHSQRAFYADILSDVRKRLPQDTRLSITALASWTLFDNWLDWLPVDEAVPMLFRMGADGENVRRYLRSGGDVRAEPARRSLGISTDEPLPRLPAGRRVYVFNPDRWTPIAAGRAVEEVMRWQGPVSCPWS